MNRRRRARAQSMAPLVPRLCLPLVLSGDWQPIDHNTMPPRSTIHAAKLTKSQMTQPSATSAKKKVLPKKEISLGDRVQRLFTSLCAQIDGSHFTNAIKTCDKGMGFFFFRDLFDNRPFLPKFSVSYRTMRMLNKQSYSSSYIRSVIMMPLHYSGPLMSPLYLSGLIRLTGSNVWMKQHNFLIRSIRDRNKVVGPCTWRHN